MTIDMLKDFLLWSFAINYSMLIVWVIVFFYWQEAIFRLHAGVFQISRPRFLTIHYQLLGVYKLAILIFNLIPFIALHLIEVS